MPCLRCGAAARDDVEFLEDAGGHRRMIICLNGHTEYVSTTQRIGRPRRRLIRTLLCHGCGREFRRREQVNPPQRAFHSRRCLVAWLPRHRQKLPPAATLRRLYCEDNLSTPQIAKRFSVTDPHTVRTALLKLGVTLRRHTVTLACIRPGCPRPVHKTLHRRNGSFYGRRCRLHRSLHLAKLSRWAKRRRAQIPPEKWRLAI